MVDTRQHLIIGMSTRPPARNKQHQTFRSREARMPLRTWYLCLVIASDRPQPASSSACTIAKCSFSNTLEINYIAFSALPFSCDLSCALLRACTRHSLVPKQRIARLVSLRGRSCATGGSRIDVVNPCICRSGVVWTFVFRIKGCVIWADWALLLRLCATVSLDVCKRFRRLALLHRYRSDFVYVW